MSDLIQLSSPPAVPPSDVLFAVGGEISLLNRAVH